MKKDTPNPLAMRIVRKPSEGPLGFSALERGTKPNSIMSFSRILKRLQEDGFVTRHVLTEGFPSRTQYQLTELGHSMASCPDAGLAAGSCGGAGP